MIEELKRIVRENNVKRVISVNLKIGKMSGIVIDSLRFAFDAIKPDYPFLSSTEIVIKEIPLVYKCNSCSKCFETDNVYLPFCPECKSYNLKLISGEELHIENLEVEV
jgi:hydrogenase nickel incorporation protein HypA/HybF